MQVPKRLLESGARGSPPCAPGQDLQIPLCTYYLDYSQLVNGLPTPFFEGLLLWGVLCLGVLFEGLLFLFIITWRNSLPNVSYCTLVPRSYRGNFSYVIP